MKEITIYFALPGNEDIMNKDFTVRLEKIAKKSGIFDLEKARSFIGTAKKIKEELPRIPDYFAGINKPISLIVGNEHAVREFIKLCPELQHVRICYFDGFRMEEAQIADMNVKEIKGTIFIVCTGIGQAWDLEAQIYNYKISGRVCNIYEYLALRGVNVKTTFYQYCKFSLFPADLPRGIFHFLRHIAAHKPVQEILLFFCRKNSRPFFEWCDETARQEIFCVKKAILSVSDSEKIFYLKKMMCLCIRDRDILDLQIYIEEYLCLIGMKNDRIRRFKEQLNCLLSEMQLAIHNNKHKRIILYWIDSVSNSRLKEMPFLYELSQKPDTCRSDKAYTCMPYTTWTMKTMFSGLRPIEGKLYKDKKLKKDYYLLSELRKKGYSFKYFGPKEIQAKMIYGKAEGIKLRKSRSLLSTAHVWETLNYAAGRGKNSKRDTFILLHTLYETHVPFFSPDIEIFAYDSAQQSVEDMERSCRWIDKQLKWCYQILDSSILQIWMSDHGCTKTDPYAYKDGRLNILFFIRNNNKKVDFEKGMFSLDRFPKLIEYLLDWNGVKEDELFKYYTIFENLDFYSLKIVDNIIKDTAALSDKRCWMQLRGIRNDRFCLVRFADGEELFFKLPDEETNLIDDLQYEDTICTMKKIMGTEMVDIYREDKFIYSRKIYEAYKAII